MDNGRLKSKKRFARVSVRCIKETKTHYRRKNRSLSKCAVTKKVLRGLPRLTNRKFKKLNKSQKRVSRPYGGYMSHIALKNKILNEIVLSENT